MKTQKLMCRSIAALSFALIVGSQTPAFAASPNGIWMRGDGNARVRIAPCGSSMLCATNLWIKDISKGEAVGDKLIMTVKPRSATEWTGKAYDPKRDWTYSMTIKVTGKTTMTTRGCIIGGLICKNISWSRVS